MITEETKNRLSKLVTYELATIYKFNGKDYFDLDEKERDIIIQVFQAGLGFMEKLEKQTFIMNEDLKPKEKELDPDEIPF